jgi:hypothetical protein
MFFFHGAVSIGKREQDQPWTHRRSRVQVQGRRFSAAYLTLFEADLAPFDIGLDHVTVDEFTIEHIQAQRI